MKKLFSILLSVAMLSALLLPMSVSAAAPYVEAKKISAAHETVIELEEYGKANATVVNETTPSSVAQLNQSIDSGKDGGVYFSDFASNGAFSYWTSSWPGNTLPDILDQRLVITIPVNVEADGIYNVSAFIGQLDNTVGTVSLKAGDRTSTAKSIRTAATGASANYLVLNARNAAAEQHYYGSKGRSVYATPYEYFFQLELTTTDTDIKLLLPPRNGNTYSDINVFVDCLKIRKETPVVDLNDVTTIEFEDYLGEDHLKTSEGGVRQSVASTVKVLPYLMVGGRNNVRIAATSLYSCVGTWPYNVAANTMSSKVAGDVVGKLNAEGTAFEDYTLTAEDLTMYPNNTQHAVFAGYYEYQIPVKVNTAGTYSFEIISQEMKAGSNYVFSDFRVFIGGGRVASGGGYERPSVVSVHKIGDEYDGTKFSHMNTAYGPYGESLKFVFNAALKPTDQYIRIQIPSIGYSRSYHNPDSTSLYVQLNLDSMKIVGPSVADSAVAANGFVDATVKYDTRPANDGKAILALYNGDELVSISNYNTYADAALNISAYYTGTVTKAKVFVWEDFVNLVPKVSVKEIAIN